MKNIQKGLGIWQIINSNIVTDIIAKSNFDLTLLDLEHGLHTPQSIQDCVFAAKSNSLFTIARIPCKSFQYIVQIIDSGIDAILYWVRSLQLFIDHRIFLKSSFSVL